MRAEDESPEPPQLSIRIAMEGPRRVVFVAGEVDLASSTQLRDCLLEQEGSVTVDLSAVEFLDSSGMGALAAGYKHLGRNGGELRLRAPVELVRRALEIAGLASWIDDATAAPRRQHSPTENAE